ncbi:hypothetical protein SAMN02745174_02224 [Cetobacterium ceti]|uniref:Uncharacterized protein n=1 Tax=Cetobacterium ceti TaxID=180163 RepID=A0A1T4Q9Q2_9FUSO|nr:hypothetical protein [Cetobacterium ceti]SJZ99928.1 hypothetical protein SAMN02745174_02224 [Cetobacterium ceti]
MSLPTRGPISMNKIKQELKINGEIRLGDQRCRNLAKKLIGKIKMSDFYGKSSATHHIIWGKSSELKICGYLNFFDTIGSIDNSFLSYKGQLITIIALQYSLEINQFQFIYGVSNGYAHLPKSFNIIIDGFVISLIKTEANAHTSNVLSKEIRDYLKNIPTNSKVGISFEL